MQHLLSQGVRRILHGAADHIGRAAGKAAVVDRRDRGVALGHVNLILGHFQHLGGDHAHRRHRAAAVVVQGEIRLHRAVGI